MEAGDLQRLTSDLFSYLIFYILGHTIYDIAKAAGVSTATVSRVFSNPDKVRDQTKDKIMKIADDLGYHPQGFAQGLARKKKNMITVVVPVISNYFFMEVLAGIQDRLDEYDYELNIVNIKPGDDIYAQIDHQLKRRVAGGYIFISIHLSDKKWKSLEKYREPIVIVDDYYHSFDSVSVDNISGAHDATLYLVNKGYKRIAVISALETSKPVMQRLEGFKKALDENEMTYDPQLIFTGDTSYRDGFTEKSGYEAMKKILNSKPLPEAVFSLSDIKSVGALKAMKEAGRELPLVSYDNLEISEYLTLTTVSQPMYEMGCKATESLIKRIIKPGIPVNHTIYKPELIIRN